MVIFRQREFTRTQRTQLPRLWGCSPCPRVCGSTCCAGRCGIAAALAGRGSAPGRCRARRQPQARANAAGRCCLRRGAAARAGPRQGRAAEACWSAAASARMGVSCRVAGPQLAAVLGCCCCSVCGAGVTNASVGISCSGTCSRWSMRRRRTHWLLWPHRIHERLLDCWHAGRKRRHHIVGLARASLRPGCGISCGYRVACLGQVDDPKGTIYSGRVLPGFPGCVTTTNQLCLHHALTCGVHWLHCDLRRHCGRWYVCPLLFATIVDSCCCCC